VSQELIKGKVDKNGDVVGGNVHGHEHSPAREAQFSTFISSGGEQISLKRAISKDTVLLPAARKRLLRLLAQRDKK
jgi:hypothetical protein